MAFSALCNGENPAYDPTLQPKMMLISALAAGADQMAAEAILRLRETEGQPNIGVQAILPFSIDDYATTMEADDAFKMRELFHCCDARMVFEDFRPVVKDNPAKIDHFRTNRRYETVGKTIVHQADFLIAVWNGLPSEGVGGTADIVLHAVSQGVPVIWIDLAGHPRIILPGDMLGDPFCTIQQRTRPFTEKHFIAILRRTLLRDLKQGAVDDESQDSTDIPKKKPAGLMSFLRQKRKPYTLLDYLQETVPQTTNWVFYQRVLASVGKHAVQRQNARRKLPKDKRDSIVTRKEGLQFNQELTAGEEQNTAIPSKERRSWSLAVDYVQQQIDRGWSGFPAALRSPEHLKLAREWAAADALATGLGHAYRSIYLLVMLLSTLAVFSALTGMVFPKHHVAFISLELALVATAIVLHTVGHHWSLHEKWMQSRELAERLRASWAPMLLGRGGRRKSRHSREHWAGRLCDAYLAEVGVPELTVGKEELRRIAEAALEGIAKEQRRYHAGNNKVLLAIHHRLETSGKLTLYFAIGVSLVLLFLVANEDHLLLWLGRTKDTVEFVVITLAAMCAMLPTLGATASALKFQGDFERSSILSHETSSQLLRVSAALRMFLCRLKAGKLEPGDFLGAEFLLDIFDDLEKYLLSDLEDWRSIYSTRGVPEPA
jgi:hypothetical protein